MSQHDDLTHTLSQELEDRAHAMDGSTLHLTDVRGRARSITPSRRPPLRRSRRSTRSMRPVSRS